MNTKATFLVLCLLPVTLVAQKKYTLHSPNQKLKTEITTGDRLLLSISAGDEEILIPSEIGLRIKDRDAFVRSDVRDVKQKSFTEEVNTPVYKKNAIRKSGNEMIFRFKGDYSLAVRCFDDGVAYRFMTNLNDSVIVEEEVADYKFPANTVGYAAYTNRQPGDPIEAQYFNSFENTYDIQALPNLDSTRLIFLPFLAKTPAGKNICVLETDLNDYPGMFLLGGANQFNMSGHHAPAPRVIEQGGHNKLQGIVKERHDYIARTSGKRDYPWRIFAVTDRDEELLNNDLAYLLAAPSKIKNQEWIRPGKVAWDWWNAWNLTGVDFVTGVNNRTYEYYIDFASRNGIEYVILDEGWAVNLEADLMQVVPDIDLPALVNYAKQRNVDLILWAGYWAYMRDMEQVTRHYSDMGIKGFKIDFLDRDDQPMINFMWEAARICADNRMLIDFHGCCKPFGLQRTYPNVINFEGVNGLEQLKWKPRDYDQVTYDVTFPFIRMVAGSVDYTQGAMRNGGRYCYQPINDKPMSQGSRCRQLATYVVFESPLNMMCDAPTSYEKEPECTEFIAGIPTVWDETRTLPGEIAKYVSVARRKGSTWYVGALNNWDNRTLHLDLSFLDPGNYRVVIFKDGVNALRSGSDYVKEIITLPANRQLDVNMAPGGGWAAKIVKF